MADQPVAPEEPGERGSLTIRDRVVSRIATTEALEVDGVVALADGLDRVRGRSLPRALALIQDDDTAVVGVHIATRWPVTLTTVMLSVQRRVSDRVHALTGLRPTRVDVTVDRIVASATESGAPAPARRVL
ncbi:MAG: Asp23/Gls24 family envelope stress response protein [Tomitella sp.]|nr:Asp23/Gls24 family envelope stress response protein [Tomitella sp.]